MRWQLTDMYCSGGAKRHIKANGACAVTPSPCACAGVTHYQPLPTHTLSLCTLPVMYYCISHTTLHDEWPTLLMSEDRLSVKHKYPAFRLTLNSRYRAKLNLSRPFGLAPPPPLNPPPLAFTSPHAWFNHGGGGTSTYTLFLNVRLRGVRLNME